MVRYSSHDLNNGLKFHYLSHGLNNGLLSGISWGLNTQQWNTEHIGIQNVLKFGFPIVQFWNGWDHSYIDQPFQNLSMTSKCSVFQCVQYSVVQYSSPHCTGLACYPDGYCISSYFVSSSSLSWICAASGLLVLVVCPFVACGVAACVVAACSVAACVVAACGVAACSVAACGGTAAQLL